MQGRKDESLNRAYHCWIKHLSAALHTDSSISESRLKTNITCKRVGKQFALLLPSDMAELQPESLRYLHVFARTHNFKLVEDRRKMATDSVDEQRKPAAPRTALGLSLLLKQTGMPGVARALSNPHRLRPDSPYIPIERLIKMAGHSSEHAKRVVVEPNRLLLDVLGKDNGPIVGHACKLNMGNSATILSHFESKHLKAIGYSAGNQYVMHLCLAGGLLAKPSLWTKPQTLTTAGFRFQLFPNNKLHKSFGLFYSTFYLDLSVSPNPWWLDSPNRRQPSDSVFHSH